jgi:DNA-binding transcriptional regulator YiaG
VVEPQKSVLCRPNLALETLALSRPVQVIHWKKGRNRPSAETALAMLELIKSKPKR